MGLNDLTAFGKALELLSRLELTFEWIVLRRPEALIILRELKLLRKSR